MKTGEIGVVIPVAMTDATGAAIDLSAPGIVFMWHITDPYGDLTQYPGTRDLNFTNVVNLTTTAQMFPVAGPYTYECWVTMPNGNLYKSSTLAETILTSSG